MAIVESDVVVGGIYRTSTNQERRVVKIEGGMVWWESRGGNVQNDWSPGHNKTQPTSLENFAQACESVVSKP